MYFPQVFNVAALWFDCGAFERLSIAIIRIAEQIRTSHEGSGNF
jgi:hypothetical protein